MMPEPDQLNLRPLKPDQGHELTFDSDWNSGGRGWGMIQLGAL